MKLTDIVALSGMTGLYKMIASRDNGVIVEDFETGKRTFASVRQHQFTPLETVGIYTHKDVEELGIIFDTLRKGEVEIPDANATGPELHAFFRKVVPDYDEGRVYIGDIKKVVKWFSFLKEKNLFERLDQEGKAREESEKEEKAKKEALENEEKRLKEEREKKAREETAKSDKPGKTTPVKEVSAKGTVKETAKAVKKEETRKAEEEKSKPGTKAVATKKPAQQKAAPKKEVKPTSAKTKSTSKVITPAVKKTASAGKKKK